MVRHLYTLDQTTAAVRWSLRSRQVDDGGDGSMAGFQPEDLRGHSTSDGGGDEQSGCNHGMAFSLMNSPGVQGVV